MAFRSLWGAKQRSFFAILGIVIGISAVIAMVSIGTIVQEEAMNQFKDLGTDFVVIQRDRSNESDPVAQQISLANVLSMPKHVPSLANVAPFVQHADTIGQPRHALDVTMLGVTHSFLAINKLVLITGRFISDLDVDMPVCVLGDDVYRKMNELGLPCAIGAKIRIRQSFYTIVGIMDRMPAGTMQPYDVNQSIFMPITTCRGVYRSVAIESIVGRLVPAASADRLTSELARYFGLLMKGITMRVRSAEHLIAQMEKQMVMYHLMLGAIGSIALLIGGVGVMNVMLVSVSERRNEIGIRRALGARRGDIQVQFLIESIILSLIGGAFGIACGIAISYVVSYVNAWHFLVSDQSIILGVAVSSAVGIFFGFYPAHQAAKLDPITALRST